MTHSIESKVTGPTSPMALDHGVPLYLAADDALIHIIDRYPADLIGVAGCDFGEEVLAARQRGEIDGAAILEAIKTGEISVTLHDIEHAHPGLWAEIIRSLGGLAPRIGASEAQDMTGQLVLSAGAARTPYAFTPAGKVMFHLRGVQRVWVYPTNETYLPQKAMERVIMGAEGASLPYVPNYDRAAWRFDITPGESLAWPLFAPHRIENQKGLCVTLAVDYDTNDTRVTTNAHRANSVLRRWRLPVFAMARTPMPVRSFLAFLSAVFARFDVLEPPVKPASPEPEPRRATEIAKPTHEPSLDDAQLAVA